MKWLSEEARHQFGKATTGFQFNIRRPTGTKMLFDFTSGSKDALDGAHSMSERQHLIDQWLVSSDRAIGGTSQCTLVLGAEGAIFSGKLSLEHAADITTTAATPEATGASAETALRKQAYCAIRAKVPRRVRDCSDFQGLEMKIRADARMYAVNVTGKSFFPDDLYQGFIQQQEPLSGDEWTTVTLPFSQFVLTSYGYAKEEQREINAESIRTVGFTVMADHEGAFRFEVAWVRAVADIDPTIFFPSEQAMQEDSRQKRIEASIRRRKELQALSRSQDAEEDRT